MACRDCIGPFTYRQGKTNSLSSSASYQLRLTPVWICLGWLDLCRIALRWHWRPWWWELRIITAALVCVSVKDGSPEVIDRRRVELIEPGCRSSRMSTRRSG